MSAHPARESASDTQSFVSAASTRTTYVDLWAWLYFALTPVIAFAMVTVGVATTKGGGDFCDPIYSSVAERDADFRIATLAMSISSVVMLAVGVLVVVSIIRRRHRLLGWRRTRLCLSVVVVGLAMAGYVLVLVTSGFNTDCG